MYHILNTSSDRVCQKILTNKRELPKCDFVLFFAAKNFNLRCLFFGRDRVKLPATNTFQFVRIHSLCRSLAVITCATSNSVLAYHRLLPGQDSAYYCETTYLVKMNEQNFLIYHYLPLDLSIYLINYKWVRILCFSKIML